MSIATTTTLYGTRPSRKIERNLTIKDDKVVGMKYSLEKNPGSGYFSKSADTEVIKSNLITLLRTTKGERFMLPDFGCNLQQFLMEPITQELFVEIREEVLSSIRKYMKNVFVSKIQVFEAKDMTLKIVLYCGYKDVDIKYFKVGVKV